MSAHLRSACTPRKRGAHMKGVKTKDTEANRCDLCKDVGLEFRRPYEPAEFIEGKTNSDIWIVGLNPAADIGWTDKERTAEDLSNAFNNTDAIHPYFKDFKKVSPRLFELFGKEHGVAHTDIVKCSSKSWPPETAKGKKAQFVIQNCKQYLFAQIEAHKPKMIICNGAPVSHQIKEVLPIEKHLSETAYQSKILEQNIVVVLSGFIGRIDDWSKKRLGYEIEALLAEIS